MPVARSAVPFAKNDVQAMAKIANLSSIATQSGLPVDDAGPERLFHIKTAIQPSRPWRLRKHADYQRVYKSSRKQFSASMAYFYAPRIDVHDEAQSSDLPGDLSPRIGLTVGRVLGKAVERNRIKRRLRAIIQKKLHLLPAVTDVILHPRRTVLELASSKLTLEVEAIFLKIASRQKASHAASTEHAR